MVTPSVAELNREVARSASMRVRARRPDFYQAMQEQLDRGTPPEDALKELAHAAKGTPEGRSLTHLIAALHHLDQNQPEQALQACHKARLVWPEIGPIASLAEAYSLALLRRYDLAFATLETIAAEAGEYFQARDFYRQWATPGLLQGLNGLVGEDMDAFEAGGQKVVTVLKSAREAGQEDAVWAAMHEVEQALPPEQRPLMEELRIYVRLMSIEDPFEAWEALGKELSKVWPKGLSVAEEVRKR